MGSASAMPEDSKLSSSSWSAMERIASTSADRSQNAWCEARS